METIIVPVDGASNIKLEVFDFHTLTPVHSDVSETPSGEYDGMVYNHTEKEFTWFDGSIRELPRQMKSARVIAPVARGASGGLIGADGSLIEVPGKGMTLSYVQKYSEHVEETFFNLAGSREDFFHETGSIRDFPGSLTLIKRFVFEELERPELLAQAARFGTYGILMTGHFIGDYLLAAYKAGNEHSYWMCHTGARNINKMPGTPSSAANAVTSFQRLVPRETFHAYNPVGVMPESLAADLGLSKQPLVIPGGHDTCLSHIPVMSTYYQAFRGRAGTPVIHVDAGSWTMVARIGGESRLPAGACCRDIIVQGTVDGQPVVTARYGGGNDFRYIKNKFKEQGEAFGAVCDEHLLRSILADADCFLLPNISPVNRMSGPYPKLTGGVINERAFYSNSALAYIVTNLTTSILTSVQIEAVAADAATPIVLTAGGSKDPMLGRLIATITGRDVYALFDGDGSAISETTSLGAAICGKAAYLNVHPYTVDVGGLCVVYREIERYSDDIAGLLDNYQRRLMEEIDKANTTP